MKNNLFKIISTSLLMLVLSVSVVGAQVEITENLKEAAGSEGAGLDTGSGDPGADLASFAGTLVAYANSFLGVIFVILIIYGGFMWMTSAGNEERISKAKKIILSGIIGLAIVLAAVAIYYLIIFAFGETGSGGLV